uniref:Uncharacterized protein n=1 Tax=Bionectria ochroleuca TaxID=29856 RepID=A0A0B7KJU0_BIOOC
MADIDQITKDAEAARKDPTIMATYEVCSELGYELFRLNDDMLKLGEQHGVITSDNRAAWEQRTSKTSAKPTREEYNAWIEAAQSKGLDVSDLEFEKCGKADFPYRQLRV